MRITCQLLAHILQACCHDLPACPWTWTGLPAYLVDALYPVTSIPGRQSLQSSSTSALDVLSTRLSTVRERAFPVATARTRNSLPAEVTSSNFLQSFKTKLKSHLFLASFSNSKECSDILAPFVAEMCNRSLSTGSVLTKATYIKPLLKKPDLNPADTQSYC